ncbi:MAG: methyltransferase domain-containing protein [Spirochaetaceae bacterium]
MNDRLFFLPEYRKGHGIGHFRRAATLVAELGGVCPIYLPPETDPARRAELTAVAAEHGVDSAVTDRLPDDGLERFLVVDRRRLRTQEVRGLRRNGIVVGLDAGGPGRRACDYLVDVLPRLDDAPANERDLRFLDVDRPARGVARRSRAEDAGGGDRILVTFGGEDPAGSTLPTVRTLCTLTKPGTEAGSAWRGGVDVLLPRLGDPTVRDELPEGVRVLEGPVDLTEVLPRYAAVVTSFGLTALEAAWTGVGVVLVNASRYHERLARKTGFTSAGVRRPRVRLLRRRLRDGGGSATVRRRLAGAEEVSLSRMLGGLRLPELRECPVCGGRNGSVVGRFPRRTYVRCSACGMLYLQSFEAPRDYDEDYFFREYRKQYGRSYLEDAPYIRETGHRRIAEMARVARLREGGRLVDLGCAYGPFLSAAAEHGFDVVGVDTSSAAVAYVREELDLPAYAMAVDELADPAARPAELGDEEAAVVSMWYVIEHLPDLHGALSTVNRLLRRGGVFAGSTPNAAGVSGRLNRHGFLEASPPDHFTLWSPRTAKAVMRRYGFAVRRVRVTGHHPERFPKAARLRRDGLRWRMLGAVSRLAGLGDTFEFYAVKRTEVRQ